MHPADFFLDESVYPTLSAVDKIQFDAHLRHRFGVYQMSVSVLIETRYQPPDGPFDSGADERESRTDDRYQDCKLTV